MSKPAQKCGQASRYRTHSIAPSGSKGLYLFFSAKFLGMVLLFSLLSLLPEYEELQKVESAWSARCAQLIVGGFLPDFSTVSDSTLYRGSVAILEVKSNCSAFHYVALLAAAMLAYPAPWIYCLIGIIAGFFIFLAANILRIVCLFLIGCYYPGWFDAVHENYWPTFSLLFTILVMASWILLLPSFACRKN